MKKFKLPQLFKKSKTSQTALCDICLIAHNNVLFHAEQQNLVAQADESMLTLSPAELAEAARRLLPTTDDKKRIALSLPSSEFVATSLTLPAISAQSLKNAVMLQLPTLLPGINEPLLLAVQAQPQGGQTVALWLSVKRAEELYRAFEKVGLFLACILPRPLVSLPVNNKGLNCIHDEDEQHVTYVEWSGSAITRWLSVPKQDLGVGEFHQQLQEMIKLFPPIDEPIVKAQPTDWQLLPMPAEVVYQYAFVPHGAIVRMAQWAQQAKRRNMVIAAGAVASCIVLLIIGVWIYESRLGSQLDELKLQTVDISKLRAEVVDIDEKIAPVKNFPRQNAAEMLDTLDKLIPKDTWITAFRLEAGNIELEGYSPNPAKLLEMVASEKRFAEVAFSRATRSEQEKKEESFGMKFKLNGINVPAYWLEYFPPEK